MKDQVRGKAEEIKGKVTGDRGEASGGERQAHRPRRQRRRTSGGQPKPALTLGKGQSTIEFALYVVLSAQSETST